MPTSYDLIDDSEKHAPYINESNYVNSSDRISPYSNSESNYKPFTFSSYEDKLHYEHQLYDNYSRDVKRGYKGSYTEYKKQFDKLARSDFSDLSTDNSEDEDSYSVTNTDYMF